MMHAAGFSRKHIAVALVLTLVVAPVGQAVLGNSAPLTQVARGAELSSLSYLEVRGRLIGVLPPDPVDAAKALAATVLGPDPAAAEVATIEILRQAGLATINLDGNVIAMPDDGIVRNAPMLGEYLARLTRSVRSGDAYTMVDVADLLFDSEMTSAEVAPEMLIAAVVGWGKYPDAPRESVFAGAAVRELGNLRGEPLFPGVEPGLARVDLIQFTLLTTHLFSDAAQVDASAAVGTLALAALTDDCKWIYDAVQMKPFRGTGSTVGNTAFKDAIFAYLEARNAETAGQFKDALKKVDYASKVANLVVFLTSIQLKMETDKPATHFRHEPGDTSRDVRVVATAEWQQSDTMQELKCLQGLAGIETRANGPMPGIRVQWRLAQEQTRVRVGKLLRAKGGQAREFTTGGLGGERTNAAGQSDLQLEPAVERNPGVGEELKGFVTVYASLEGDDLPDVLKSFLGNRSFVYDYLKGKEPSWSKFLFDVFFDLSLKAIKRAGMPTRKTTIQVDYHGADAYAITGTVTPFLFYYAAQLQIHVFTCAGLDGEWQGTMDFFALQSGIADAAETVFGVDFPNQVRETADVRQHLDLRNRPDVMFLKEPFRLHVEVDATAAERGQFGKVGTADVRIEDHSLGPLLLLEPTSELPVLRLDKDNAENFDQLCPGSESYFP